MWGTQQGNNYGDDYTISSGMAKRGGEQQRGGGASLSSVTLRAVTLSSSGSDTINDSETIRPEQDNGINKDNDNDNNGKDAEEDDVDKELISDNKEGDNDDDYEEDDEDIDTRRDGIQPVGLFVSSDAGPKPALPPLHILDTTRLKVPVGFIQFGDRDKTMKVCEKMNMKAIFSRNLLLLVDKNSYNIIQCTTKFYCHFTTGSRRQLWY